MKRNDCIEVLDHLKEKLKEKDIIAVQDSEDDYKCPVCGQIFTGEDIIKYSYKWCDNCGQIQESRHNMTELEPRKDDVSNTLTTVQKDNLVLEKPQYRIRKLTPRECGRLMGVSDEDIDKMAAVNSNTQLYKQFGNSIVIGVMCAMFKNLHINQGDSNETLQTN